MFFSQKWRKIVWLLIIRASHAQYLFLPNPHRPKMTRKIVFTHVNKNVRSKFEGNNSLHSTGECSFVFKIRLHFVNKTRLSDTQGFDMRRTTGGVKPHLVAEWRALQTLPPQTFMYYSHKEHFSCQYRENTKALTFFTTLARSVYPYLLYILQHDSTQYDCFMSGISIKV